MSNPPVVVEPPGASSTVSNSAASLELDPKFFARLAYQPLSGSSDPLVVHDVLQMALVRFDDHDSSKCWRSAAVSGWCPNGDLAHECFTSVSLPPGTLRCQDWHAAKARNCWFGISRSGRFGLVVPVKHQQHQQSTGKMSPMTSPRRAGSEPFPPAPTSPSSSAKARHALIPRSIAITPPYVAAAAMERKRQQQNEPSPATTAVGSDQLRAQHQQQHFNNNMSFIDGPSPSFMSNSFAACSPLFISSRPTQAFAPATSDAGDSAEEGGTPAAFGESQFVDHEQNAAAAAAAAQLESNKLRRELGEPVVTIAETEFSEGIAGHRGEAALPLQRHSSLLSTCPWNPATKVEGTFTNGGDLLPLFLAQRPGMLATSFAQWVAKAGSAKMPYDAKQFVALIGDSRGLCLLTPGRDPTRHIAASSGITPIFADSSGFAMLDRGVYELSITGMLGSSSTPSNAGYFSAVGQRYSLLTTQRLTSLVDIVVKSGRNSRKRVAGALIDGSHANPRTKIRELLFTQPSLTCEDLEHLDDVEESAATVSSDHVFESHANWGEPVDLGSAAGLTKKSKRRK